jgi:hypothetical protein
MPVNIALTTTGRICPREWPEPASTRPGDYNLDKAAAIGSMGGQKET